jgi:hypothetical protein
LVAPAGLSGSYYANKWFSPQAAPYLSRIDPEINFSWGTAEDIIPKIAREYVSIEWEGYLLPSLTGSYSFKVEADDGVQVIVNGQTLIDSMIDVASGATQSIVGTPALTLTAATAPNQQLVPIRIRYY